MNNLNKSRVKEQFGASAPSYATSAVHARGASLARTVELVQPDQDWRVLDVATAAGHTAHFLAPHVSCVVATDITVEMLAVARAQAEKKLISNVRLSAADAENLPFVAGCFELVTCRIAAHHFPAVGRFMAEAARVLKTGGTLVVVDNVVPGSRLQGRKAQRQREAGRYVNAFERLRDPSHVRCLSLDEWQRHFYEAGFRVSHHETAAKTIGFEEWAARMQVSPDDVTRLQVMLRQAPKLAAAFLAPQFRGEQTTFQLLEAILVGVLEIRRDN